MSRSNQRFKRTVNAALERFSGLAPGDLLGTEAQLAEVLGASRTTVRSVLEHLRDTGMITWEGREKCLLRPPRPEDFFKDSEVVAPLEQAERAFLEWILRTDLPPGSTLKESEIARRIGAPLPLVHELMIRFAPLGLFSGTSGKGWLFAGFTRSFAEEMFEMRLLVERHAFARLLKVPPDGPEMRQLAEMERRHIALYALGDSQMNRFPALDAAFHRLICDGAQNRFVNGFAQQIALVVHYHYRWNKRDEASRNRAAIAEHLEIIRALLTGDKVKARRAFEAHLATARTTLLASAQWD
ncbi:GntR family transcriptional regulator [Acidimangrovimonas sediminis]|uniref:GntR family transcriptional regulator n=1 Tax=Acidimangrovimonas sediminis TaxID=2056283 RepID=UPI000C80E9F8|nr:GntR family transcriptional regulator [Acidimangrovimonas sediminis]